MSGEWDTNWYYPISIIEMQQNVESTLSKHIFYLPSAGIAPTFPKNLWDLNLPKNS